jgi:hypothetical protein
MTVEDLDGREGRKPSDGSELDDRLLGKATGLDQPAPPPAPALMKAVAAMKPVRMRGRFGAFLIVALLGLVAPVATLLLRPLRRDLHALPRPGLVVAALAWGLSFVLTLAATLVPRRGDVLPSAGRAARVGTAALVVLALFALMATLDVPGVSVQPAGMRALLESCVHCAGYIAKIAALFLLAGVLALRRLAPVGRSRLGMALGAAGGAMGGLVLVFLCPIGGAAHMLLGHVGGMALAAGAGALLLPGLLRR